MNDKLSLDEVIKMMERHKVRREKQIKDKCGFSPFDEAIETMKRDYFAREEEMFKSFHATEMERLKKEIDTNLIISIVWASISVFLSAMALTVALNS